MIRTPEAGFAFNATPKDVAATAAAFELSPLVLSNVFYH
jgi:hypothetical protein